MANDYLNDVPRPHRKHFTLSLAGKPQQWTIRSWCLICSMATVGVFVPLLVISSGAINLDSFNDVVRYLPGYIYFANNFLALIFMLLLVSFAALAWFPTWQGLLLGLPLHLLIVFIFKRLLNEWVPWCLTAYVLMVLAPAGSSIFVYIKTTTQRYLNPTTVSFCGIVLGPVGRRAESALFLLSHNNRSAALPRFWIGFLLALSFAVPVIVNNERRHFYPAQADPRFDILRPEPLCPAPVIFRKGGLSHVSEGALVESEEKTFDDYWQEYLIFHRNMVAPEDRGGVPLSKKKFLVFTPTDDGLGNRLQALLSTVVLAMVTKRAIVLDWRASPQCNAEFLDLFEQPDGLAWDHASVRYNLYDSTNVPPWSMPGEWLPYCRSCLIRKPISPASSWSRLLCGTDLGIDKSQPWLQILSTQWFLPVIQHNPFWRAELCRMFPDAGRNAFQLLAQKLLRPAHVVQDKIDQVMDRIPKDATLIGLQVRRTENNAVGNEIEEAFLGCADQVVEEEIEKSHMAWIARQKLGSTASRKQRLLSEVEELWAKREKRKQQPKFAYFLATDYHPTRMHFQDILGDELFVLENTFDAVRKTSPSTPSPAAAQVVGRAGNAPLYSSSPAPGAKPSSLPQRDAVARNSVLGVQTAVAEMFLLAQADRIISSPYSTFGYFAHGYANVQPNIVKRDGTCIRRKSTQPCFQYWFGFANGGTSCPVRATIEMSEDYDCWL
ncbi:hypothetical protein BG006_010035 [Podila minutissima]|uniref:Uncharacterized protein n=1 Tax=Podila minutissima TaxID=64525 RepID=A0A9P5VIH6_9FUNG|nr:hypothetical protein BG006_010035 [Podila minutissima]